MKFSSTFKTVTLATFLVATHAYSFDFKGYQLGMNLSNFKEQGIHEDSFLLKKYDRYNNWETKLICSDSISSEFTFQLNRYPQGAIVVCAFREVGTSSRGTSISVSYAPSFMWLKLKNNTFPISPSFTFVAINENEPILSMIDFEVSSDNFDALSETMIEKYKKPKNHSSQFLQNSFGAKFKNETYLWKDAKSEIEIKKYAADTTLDKSSIYFFFKQGELKMEKLLKQKSQETNKGF